MIMIAFADLFQYTADHQTQFFFMLSTLND